jgi:energy-converting hydrogenase B subunit D
MRILQGVMFVLVAAVGTLTVLTRDPVRQALIFSLYGSILTIFCVVVQAGDVALSELAVGTAATPLMLLVTLASVRKPPKRR